MQDTYPGKRSSTTTTGVTLLGVTYLLFTIALKSNLFFQTATRLFPLALIISLIVLLFYQKHWNIRSLSFLFVIFFGGFFLQAVATETGIIYGDFAYGRSLGPKLFGTPLIIGILWLLLIYSVGCTIKDMKVGLWAKCFLGAAILVLFDILMEPVAREMDLWDWQTKERAIPLQNYFAWFFISFVMFIYFFNLRAKVRNNVAPFLFVIMMLFFLIMNI